MKLISTISIISIVICFGCQDEDHKKTYRQSERFQEIYIQEQNDIHDFFLKECSIELKDIERSIFEDIKRQYMLYQKMLKVIALINDCYNHISEYGTFHFEDYLNYQWKFLSSIELEKTNLNSIINDLAKCRNKLLEIYATAEKFSKKNEYYSIDVQYLDVEHYDEINFERLLWNSNPEDTSQLRLLTNQFKFIYSLKNLSSIKKEYQEKVLLEIQTKLLISLNTSLFLIKNQSPIRRGLNVIKDISVKVENDKFGNSNFIFYSGTPMDFSNKKMRYSFDNSQRLADTVYSSTSDEKGRFEINESKYEKIYFQILYDSLNNIWIPFNYKNKKQ